MCAFYCFICNDYHSSAELGGFIDGKPVCEMQLALVVALGEMKECQIQDLRKKQLTTHGKEQLLKELPVQPEMTLAALERVVG